MRIGRFAFALALSIALQVPLPAQIYVSTAGNDLWAGTYDSAFATIPRAVTAASAGDTIYVRGGTYAYAATITLSKNGTAGSRYYLFAYPGERALLDFSAMAVSSSNRGVRVSGSWWHIKGFDLYKAGDNGMHISGSNNIVEFCSFFENYDTGLQLSGGASNNQIINCDSYYNADPSQGNADGFAPKLDVGTGNSFYGCRAWQNSDDGFDGYLRPSDGITTTYENCWCFKNGYLKNGSASVGNGNGFKMGGSDAQDLRHRVVMKNCMAFDNRVKGFDQNNNKGSMTLLNCTAYRNGTNYSISGALAAGETLKVINCDVLGSYGTLGSFAIQQTNSWLSPFVVDATDFVSVDTTGVRGPRAADGSLPEVGFMHLAAGSDLIDAGTDVGIAYNGPGPDLGAFEHAASVITHAITATAGIHGSINPSGTVNVEEGASQQFTFTPDLGYHIDSVIVDGAYAGTPALYTFTNVAADHTLRVVFALTTYTIVATSSGGGSLSPPDTTIVGYGGSQHYAVQPDAGHHCDSLRVDGVRVDSTAGYTFVNVTASHTIAAFFSANMYTLAVSIVGSGTVGRNPDQPSYAYGTEVLLTAVPAAGWSFSAWSGDTAAASNPLAVTMIAGKSITATFARDSAAAGLAVKGSWNLISLPLDVADPRKTTLFPSAVSEAFTYRGAYSAEDTIRRGVGYWVKFAADETVGVAGTPILGDTVEVEPGWNMVGSISLPVAAAGLASIPPGIVTTEFFGYADAYLVADTLLPGFGYWVKVDQAGSLILASGSSSAASSQRICIRPSGERPPAAPGENGSGLARPIPAAFALGQNYPNPFNPSTRFAVQLPREGRLEIGIYTLIGQCIRTLADAEFGAGSYEFTWDGMTDRGTASGGVYLVRMTSGTFSAVRKIVMMK